jgi:hypothetical protein
MPQLDFFNVLSQLESTVLFFLFFYFFTVFFVVPTILTIFNLRLAFITISTQLFNSFFVILFSNLFFFSSFSLELKNSVEEDFQIFAQFVAFNSLLITFFNFNELH